MKITIAGGSGMVGQELSKTLLEQGHQVTILSRSNRKSTTAGLSYSQWSPNEQRIDVDMLCASDVVINLTGSSIAQRWTPAARKEILQSRVNSTHLLSRVLQDHPSSVHTFINASAIGFYEPGNEERTEEDPAGDHFMAEVCKAWEESVDLPESAVRKVILRIGVVLEKDGGALKKMSLPFKLGLGAPIGSGNQFMSIIHVEDLVRLMIFAIENKQFQGVYNAVAPENPSNRAFSRQLAKSLNRPFFLPPVPAFALRLAMGQTAESVLMSFRVSSKKLTNAGFQFFFPDTKSALDDIYNAH